MWENDWAEKVGKILYLIHFKLEGPYAYLISHFWFSSSGTRKAIWKWNPLDHVLQFFSLKHRYYFNWAFQLDYSFGDSILSKMQIFLLPLIDGRGRWRQRVAGPNIYIIKISPCWGAPTMSYPSKIHEIKKGWGIYCFKLFPLVGKTWWMCIKKWANDRSGTRSWVYIPPVITRNACLVTSWRMQDNRAGIEELKKGIFDHWAKMIY